MSEIKAVAGNRGGFSFDFQSVIAIIKKYFKKLVLPLAGNKKLSTFAPAFEREQVLKNKWGD